MRKNSVLWKLTKSGYPSSYLFGTMHVKDDVAFAHLEKAVKALSYCTHFMAEMNLDLAQQNIKPTDYLIPDNEDISKYYKPKHYAKMQRILKKAFDFDLTQWEKFYPIMIINRITELILSDDHSLPLDTHLWSMAKAKQLKLDGLETVEDQISTLHSLKLEVQLKMLRELCKDVKMFRKRIFQLVDKYENGDIVSIYKLSKKGLGQLKDPLLYSRNKKMAHKIIESMGNPVFFAAGAAHLAGSMGILSLVKSKGIKVEAI